ncbi:MAG: thymidine phosphorylase [Rhizobiaceae bacterium]|nr:thymidine phosphorylase [Rhizobiaceae bacterium]
MLPQEIIRKKRDGLKLEVSEISEFIEGVTAGVVKDSQMSALAMAVFFNGMERDETVALTKAMRDSGEVLDWSDLDGPVLDKHSTGGVGDNVSLMLAPVVAACGGFVPMISGRGLGHTGGTLDKFDSIPGYQTQPDIDVFRKVTKEVGCAIIGQTGNLAPADKRIYGIRDVTATVESVPLITASILSKKLAAGLHGLVLDVKVGSGAFMPTLEKAQELTTSLVEVANGAGLATTALLTDMDHPLANCAGNGVEMRNAVNFLTGAHIDPVLYEVTVALGAEMLLSGKLAGNREEATKKIEAAFSNGLAAEFFGKMVAALGGPSDFIENMETYLDRPEIEIEVHCDQDITDLKGNLGFDTREIGLAVIELGGGRTSPSDQIDHAVGIIDIAPRNWDGEQPICRILARSNEIAEKAALRIRNAIRPAGKLTPAILQRVDG